jgi:hypothetical protein
MNLTLSTTPDSEESNFNTTLLVGPLIIGANISILMAGFNLSQCVVYFRSFRDDKMWTRLSVLTVCIMDTAHFVLITTLLYYLFSTNFGNSNVFGEFPVYYAVHCFFTAIVHVAVQAQYIYRVSLITRSRILSTSCLVLLTTRIIGITVLGILIAMGHVTEETLHRWIRLGITLLGVGAAGDVLVAASLGVRLWRQRKTMISSRRGFVNGAMVVIIQTGLLTSLSSLIYLIILVLYPYTSIWPGVSFIVPRVYSISLTTSLNHRTRLRSQADITDLHSLSLWGTVDPQRDPTPKSALVFARRDTVTMTRTQGVGLGIDDESLVGGDVNGDDTRLGSKGGLESGTTTTTLERSWSDIGRRSRVDSLTLDGTEKGFKMKLDASRSNPELRIPISS